MNQSTSKSDEEIRVKVAELMGVKPVSYGWFAYNPETDGIALQADFKREIEDWIDAGFNRRKTYIAKEDLRFPDYLNDPSAALQLCHRMREQGWQVATVGRSLNTIWVVDFIQTNGLTIHSASDPSFPRAVTLAFLKCHELRTR